MFPHSLFRNSLNNVIFLVYYIKNAYIGKQNLHSFFSYYYWHLEHIKKEATTPLLL